MVKRQRITIKDVAREAGVSPSTVSRVISKNPRISKVTTESVLSHMKRLGYHPNAIARNLARNSSKTIGLIMPDSPGEALLNPFFPEALRGIIKASTKYGYDILLSSTAEINDIETVKGLVSAAKVDGVLVMTSKIENKSIEYLREIEFPFSVIGSPYDDVDDTNHVDNDNERASHELTSYLLEKGSKSIALITGGRFLTVTEQRIKGFRRALLEKGINKECGRLFVGEFDEKTGYRYAKEIINSGEEFDAVVATDDVVAYGVVSAFIEIGLSVPEDIMVAGFNNSILSRQCSVPITSVEIHADLLGAQAVDIIIENIRNGERQEKRTVPYTIYKRKSTWD
ncbi:LacI family DNA-binding transcriptional regulator [Gudongella sp. DL1XJH-153]|uniref:LacI family DNA-binding transcriptional regulator n=1 Tax=Gudongella sp. DL1XJH-153 TaxID=3409804 RepID=UPI003BB7DB32